MASPKTPRKKGTQRKLAAILCADVGGFSRLMGEDEEATIETLTAYRKVFLSHIEIHSGRLGSPKARFTDRFRPPPFRLPHPANPRQSVGSAIPEIPERRNPQ